MASSKLKCYFEFTLTDKNRMNGLCQLCQRNYKDLHGIYSNFIKHLKRKHVAEYKKIFSTCTTSGDGNMSDEMDDNDQQQQSNDFTQINSKQYRINVSLAKNLIIKCNLPLNTIENAAFREFVKDCYPKWQPISSKKLKVGIIASMNDRIYNYIHETLEKTNYVTLTIDAWSDRRHRSFLGITCHFIDNNMIPQAFLIDFVRMKSPHTSESIQRLTEYVLDRFNIRQKVYRIITDNASSMIKAYKFGLATITDKTNTNSTMNEQDFEIIEQPFVSVGTTLRLSCFAHTLQLTVRDGLEKNQCIAKILNKCELLAESTHKSSKISDMLDQINKHIHKSNVTRWNSDYMLIKSILAIDRKELEMILNSTENFVQFTSTDFTIMEEIVDILEPFYQISLKCQADKVVTVSLVVPSIVHLVCHLRSMRENLSSSCQEFIEQLQSSIEKRFTGIIHRLYDQDVQLDDPFNDPIYFMTSVLDPMFKFFWIYDLRLPINVENRLKQNIIQLILDEINKESLTKTTTTLLKSSDETNSSSITTSKNSTKRMKLFAYDEQYYDNKHLSSSTTISNPSLEIEAYLNDPIRIAFSDYWSRSSFSSLKQLVIRIFSVQASSAPIERVFSHAGLILTSRRTRLNEQLFRDIVFLKANQSLL